MQIEFGEIQKFSRLTEQAGESNNKYSVNCIFVQNQGTIVHLNVILKTHIAVFSCESTISCMLFCQLAQLAC